MATKPEEFLLPSTAEEADHREILARPPQAQHLGTAARARVPDVHLAPCAGRGQPDQEGVKYDLDDWGATALLARRATSIRQASRSSRARRRRAHSSFGITPSNGSGCIVSPTGSYCDPQETMPCAKCPASTSSIRIPRRRSRSTNRELLFDQQEAGGSARRPQR